MGLALAVASAWAATQGLKVLVGKPRPDLLARCDPDLSRIAEFTVGGLGERVRGAATLVSWEICRDRSNSLRIDGFASFPSGHSSCTSYTWSHPKICGMLIRSSLIRRPSLSNALAVLEILSRISLSA